MNKLVKELGGVKQTVVYYGSDFAGWTPALHDGANVIVDDTDGSPDDIVEVRIRRTLAQDGRLFARLVVTMPSS